MYLSKLRNVIILIILPIILAVSGTPNQLTINDKVNVIDTSVPAHSNTKIDKKIKKLEKKLIRITEKKEKKAKKKEKEKNKKAKPLLIIGLLSLLGAIVLIAISAEQDRKGGPDSNAGCGTGTAGILLLLLGILTMIIWLFVK